jgi:hypothetical protein
MPAKLTQEEFITRAMHTHKDRYDYTETLYERSSDKVTITCRIHGPFEQFPSDHVKGSGCPRCGWEKDRNRVQPDNTGRPCTFKGKSMITKEQFVETATKVHNNYYDYSKLEMVPQHQHGIIICPVHGEFAQRLNDHRNGAGCPTCGKAKQGQYSERYFTERPEERDTTGYLYLIQLDEYCKVGITKRTVGRRFPGKHIKKITSIKTTLYDAWSKEQELLRQFYQQRYQFPHLQHKQYFTGWTECFPLEMTEPLKQYIMSLR